MTQKQMTLGDKQRIFAKNISLLIGYIYSQGHECTYGDFWSKPEYKAHRANSVHYLRLAGDINLFKDGVYLDKTEDHLKFGLYWETLHPDNRWGGNWDKDDNPFEFGETDGNHYSMRHEGKA